MRSTEFVLVVESLNQKTGLGSKICLPISLRVKESLADFQKVLGGLERDLTPRYGYMRVYISCAAVRQRQPYRGTIRVGGGGLK